MKIKGLIFTIFLSFCLLLCGIALFDINAQPSTINYTKKKEQSNAAGTVTLKDESDFVYSSDRFNIKVSIVGISDSGQQKMVNADVVNVIFPSFHNYFKDPISGREQGVITIIEKTQIFGVPKSDASWTNGNVEKVRSVTMPTRLTQIGKGVFDGCTGLQEVIFSQPFSGSIGPIAFGRCSSLTSINLSADSTIKAGAFAGCSSLQSIGISTLDYHCCSSYDDVISSSNYPFTTGGYFSGCGNLDLTMDLSAAYGIDEYSFNGCQKMKFIVRNNVEVGDYAFFGCTLLDTFSDIMNTIGDYAFSGCGFTHIKIDGYYLKKIGKHAFENCTKLETVEIIDITSSNVFGEEIFGWGFTFMFDRAKLLIIAENQTEYTKYITAGHPLQTYYEVQQQYPEKCQLTYALNISYEVEGKVIQKDKKLFGLDLTYSQGEYWTQGNPYTLPEGVWQTKEGQVVDYDILNAMMTNQQITGDIVLVQGPYIIHFDPNEGEGTMDDIVAPFTAVITIPKNTFIKQGCVFKCWNTSPDGGGDEIMEKQKVSKLTSKASITLYAQYDETWGMHTSKPNGTGSKDDPFLISSAEELAYVSANVQNGDYTYDGMYLKQTADINLAGYKWLPIGNEQNSFKGNYNGNNFVIQNMQTSTNLNAESDFLYDCVGLFGSVGPGSTACTIENVVILGNSSVYGNSYVGGIVGKGTGLRIINCLNISRWVLGNDYGSSFGGEKIGGIVGGCDVGLISQCFNFSMVMGGDSVGGIIGYGNVNIDGCYAKCTIRASGNNIGGIVGDYFYGTNGNPGFGITSCVFEGSFDINVNDSFGLIIGRSEVERQMSFCYAKANIDLGLIGEINSDNFRITDSIFENSEGSYYIDNCDGEFDFSYWNYDGEILYPTILFHQGSIGDVEGKAEKYITENFTPLLSSN